MHLKKSQITQLIQNELRIFKTTNTYSATNEDTAATTGTPSVSCNIGDRMYFHLQLWGALFFLPQSNSDFTLSLSLSSVTSRGIIRKEEQRYLNWKRVFGCRSVVHIWSVAKALLQQNKAMENQTKGILKILKCFIEFQ